MVEANKNCEPYLLTLGQECDIIALSNKKGFSDFYIEKINPIATGASIYRENTNWYSDGMYEKIQVETDLLDSRNYFPNESIDLIKIDVQGSELDILHGGEKTLERTNFILVELSLVEYNLNAPMIEDVVDKIKKLNFKMVDILEYHRFLQINNGQVFQLDILFENKK